MSAVFVIHNGNQEYLRHCLRFSRQNGNYTILVGNEKSFQSECDKFFSDDIELPEFERFVSTYVHMSSNSEWFEILCFKRYFLLLAMARKLNLESFWMIDSDVLLLEDLAVFQDYLTNKNYKACLSTMTQTSEYDWSSSPHISFWTRKSLESFVEFTIDTYAKKMSKLEEKFNYHKANSLAGGICDMTLLFLWASQTDQIYNTSKAHLDGHHLYDHNINLIKNVGDDHFQSSRILRMKTIKPLGGNLVTHELVSKRDYIVGSLHFQGRAKRFIPSFAKAHSTKPKHYLLLILAAFTKKLRI
jgi:hypothetical protein